MQISFEHLSSRITKEDILSQVSQEAIYKRWCKEFPSRLFPSPFRKDKNPSFGFYKRDMQWLWKDHGGNGDSGDVFEFVMKAERTDFVGALKAIAEAFRIREGFNDFRIGKKFSEQAYKNKERGRALIQVIQRPLHQTDLNWWNRINIRKPILDYYECGAAKEVWVDKKLYWFEKDDNPIYFYKSTLSSHIKCYRPLETNKRRRWLSNQDPLRDVQGYDQCNIKLQPGKPLLLVKSMKEVMFFRNFHINAMANTGEHAHYHADFIRHLRKYCGPILYLGDNDWPGMRALIKLERLHQIPGIIIPRSWGAKDPTDLWLANYIKIYQLLNSIHDSFQYIAAAKGSVVTSRELRNSRAAA